MKTYGIKRLFINRRNLTRFAAIAAIFSFFAFNFPISTSAHQTIKIGISQIAQHPALDQTREGIVDELIDQGFDPSLDIEIKYQNAQGKIAIAAQIAQQFLGQGVDVMVGIATGSAQTCYSVAKGSNIPVVFATVTDPVAAGLVPSPDEAMPYITGVSNFTKLEPQFEMFQKMVPGLKRIGIIYNPGEVNSVQLNALAKEVAGKMGLEIVLSAANKTSEVKQAALNLVGKADAIFINNDNNALAGFKSIVSVCDDYQIPLFVSDTDMVDQGAVAALGPNQYLLGRQAGRMVADMILGKTVQKMEYAEKVEVVVNQDAAAKQGVIIPAGKI